MITYLIVAIPGHSQILAGSVYSGALPGLDKKASLKLIKCKSYYIAVVYAHLEMESYGISNMRKIQIFLDFSSVVIDGLNTSLFRNWFLGCT